MGQMKRLAVNEAEKQLAIIEIKKISMQVKQE